MQRIISQLVLFVTLCVIAQFGYATPGLNMPYGVTPNSHDIYFLHMACFYICCVIGVGVFGVLIYSLIVHRKSKGAKANHFHQHLGVEIVWTVIPFLILVALAVPATIILQHIHNYDDSKLTIKIVGYQWKWGYEYLDQGISFISSLPAKELSATVEANDPWFLLEVDHPLVVPINTKIKLLVTADDVIHSWWVPEVGVKQDAIPGYINENWMYITKTGIYRGQCAELCGLYHGFMPIVIKAVNQDEFNQWVAAQQQKSGNKPVATSAHATNNTAAGAGTTAASGTVAQSPKSDKLKTLTENELMTMGQTQFETSCSACHQTTGLGLPPTFPALKNAPITTGPLNANISFVLNGKPGTAMQAFGSQLDDTALAGVITYIRHAWGNDKINQQKGNAITVQPEAVAKIRNQK